MTRPALAWTLALLAGALMAPLSVSAQSQGSYTARQLSPGRWGPDRVRVALVFGPHFGGRAEQASGAGSTTVDLGVAPSLGARLEIPLGRVLVIGGFFDFVSLQARDAPSGADRLTLLGAGLWLKGRAILEFDRSLLELYLGAPIGLSVWVPPVSYVDPEFGVALGLLGGVQAYLSDGFAIFAEAGFRLDYFRLSGAETTYLQAAVHAGVSFGF